MLVVALLAIPIAARPRIRRYETRLSPTMEIKFQRWKAIYAPRDSGIDYDLRGAFKAGLTPDPAIGPTRSRNQITRPSASRANMPLVGIDDGPVTGKETDLFHRLTGAIDDYLHLHAMEVTTNYV